MSDLINEIEECAEDRNCTIKMRNLFKRIISELSEDEISGVNVDGDRVSEKLSGRRGEYFIKED